MSLFQIDVGKPPQPEAGRGLGQRLFARFSLAAILLAVALIVLGWIGVLAWVVMWLLG
ncbi:hypothetical protein [Methylobacterium longum]|uniref:Uncharacterized protein n=1 Tax=Methylobacterium longum TaxID=767694 RepID=A0ABT8AYL3_9HYPH|nr:hypothetical protein [Methylobacterium longum]MDN3575093.1 hypothetical protein [Methylobacterium longum]